MQLDLTKIPVRNFDAAKRVPAVWCLICGMYGDAILSFGRARSLYGARPMGILHYGPDPAVADFLGRQDGVIEVRYEAPRDMAEYERYVKALCYDPWVSTVSPLLDLPERFGVPAKDIVQCQIEHEVWYGQPIFRWSNPRLSKHATEFGAPLSAVLNTGKPWFLLQPWSIGSSCPSGWHWDGWTQLIELLLGYTPYNYVLVGRCIEVEGAHPRLLNFVDKTLNMEELFALSDMASATITTCNGLAHYCAVSGSKAYVMPNRQLPGSVFERFLMVPNIRLFGDRDTPNAGPCDPGHYVDPGHVWQAFVQDWPY